MSKKKHHYRPVLHLRHFADANGRLWTYDRTGIPPFQNIPKNVGYERLLYAPKYGTNPEDDAFEEWLADYIDTPAAGPLNRLLDGVTPSIPDRSRIASFLAMQDMRTLLARDVLLASAREAVQESYAQWTADLSRLRTEIGESTGTWYSPEELVEHVEGHAVEVTNGAWLDFIHDSVNPGAERVFHMRWQVVDAPRGCDFITNDLGIAKFFTGFDTPCSWRIGFSVGATHWFVPLSTKKGLAISPREDERAIASNPTWCRSVNKRLVLDAHRFVFSQQRQAFVEALWRKYEGKK
jgi:hypothetical protein